MPLAIPFLFIVLAIGGMAVVSLSQPFGSALTGWLKSLGLFGTVLVGPVAKLTIGLASWISNRVGAAILDATGHVVGWFGALYAIIAHVFTSALMWPIEMLRFQEWLLTRGIPRLVRALAAGVTSIATVGLKRLTALERAIVSAEKFLIGRIKPIALAVALSVLAPWLPLLHLLRAALHVLQHAIPKALDLPSAREWAGLGKRVDRLSRLLAPAAITAALITALVRIGAGWIRCTKVKRIGKKACGFDDSWIGSFIADALLITSAISIVELTKDLQKITPAVADGIGYFVREAPAGFHAITDAERAAANAIASEADSIINRL